MKVQFMCRSGSSAEDLLLPSEFVLLHGEQLDDRGKLACGSAKYDSSRVKLTYDVEQMSLTVGNTTKPSDLALDLLSGFDMNKVILEATTLGFAELFCATNALLANGAKSLDIIYVEPGEYQRASPGGAFELSEPTRGYGPIPNSIVDLASDDVEAGVFFLGFEPERLDRALEEHQMISTKAVKLVFGIPAYHPGWELNAIIPHLPALEQHKLSLDYCSANDPEAAFECLERTRASLGDNKRMFVAPIGTKPCGIATAIFASVYPNQVGLLFDHPRRKQKRSTGTDLWHRFTVTIDRGIERGARTGCT